MSANARVVFLRRYDGNALEKLDLNVTATQNGSRDLIQTASEADGELEPPPSRQETGSYSTLTR